LIDATCKGFDQRQWELGEPLDEIESRMRDYDGEAIR
jgi:hypothetical protein